MGGFQGHLGLQTSRPEDCLIENQLQQQTSKTLKPAKIRLLFHQPPPERDGFRLRSP